MSERDRYVQVRVLGSDTTGKSSTCEAFIDAVPEFVQFSSTEPYVYDWLRTYGLNRPSAPVADAQIPTRRHIFMAYNRFQNGAVSEITRERPVVAVRGRADTIITHDVLEGKNPTRGMNKLFPGQMRPDILVVQTAPADVIAGRLAERGQDPTGTNALEHLMTCQDYYMELGNLAARNGMEVYVVDTSDPRNTPHGIVDRILGETNFAIV